MNRMKDTDWEKLPNGFMWRRDPSTMKFIGLRSAGGGKDSRAGGVAARETATGSSGTLTMTSTTFTKAEESLGTLKKTSGTFNTVRGSFGTIQKTSRSSELVRGPLGTPKTTERALETTGVSLGTFETSAIPLGTSSKTIGTVPTAVELSERARIPSVSIHGTPRLLTRVDVPFVTTKGTLGSFATAHETLGTAKATSGSIRMSASTKGMSVTMGTTARAIGSIRASGTTVGLMHTPIIQHIIRLCGFGTDSVFGEYINKEGWTKSFHATSMSFSDVDEIHTVEKNGYTFKARPSDKELKMFKAFLMFHTRMSRRWNRSLDENDIMKLITESTFHCYLCSAYHQEDIAASGSFDIPFFDELVAAGVFHIESAPPSVNPTLVTTAVVPPSSEDDHGDDIKTLETVSFHEDSNETLFVESWNNAVVGPEEVGTMYDEEEEVVTFDSLPVECDNGTFVDSLDIGSVDGKERKAMFKGKDNAIDPLTASRCSLDIDSVDEKKHKAMFKGKENAIDLLTASLCLGTIGKVLKVKSGMMDQRTNRWGADGKETNVISLGQWGAEDAYPENKSGEENVVVFIQRMLIAVMDRRQVSDPGGGSLIKESKIYLVQQ